MDTVDQERYERARKQVAEIRDFYTHAAVYVVVNIGIFIIDMVTDGGPWFYWPLIGWGIGLMVHGISVFGPETRLGRDWEERKIREIMARDKR
jgi:hypothetical protein